MVGVVLWILKVSKSVKGTIQYVHRGHRSKLAVFLTFLSIVSFFFVEKMHHTPPHPLDMAIFAHTSVHTPRGQWIFIYSWMSWIETDFFFAPCSSIELTSFRFVWPWVYNRVWREQIHLIFTPIMINTIIIRLKRNDYVYFLWGMTFYGFFELAIIYKTIRILNIFGNWSFT